MEVMKMSISRYRNENDTLFKVGIYLRLSQEDKIKKDTESNSIENQRRIIKKYIDSNEDLVFISEYVDDGYSGTSFNRPGFQEMLKDLKKSKIDTIIVKDLSRFGRNYVEVGRYLEDTFPTMRVRFISIIDKIDSFKNPESSSSMLVNFKNLINDEYARDISRKIKSVYRIKQKKGEYIAAHVPFGYRKDPDNKYHLLIDMEGAKIVKLIFELALNNKTAVQIADYLNERKFPTPSQYKKQKGQSYKTNIVTDENIDEINTNLYMKVHKNAITSTSIIPNVINPFNEEVDTKKTIEYLLKINKLHANKIVILDDLERYASSDYDAFLSYLTSLIGTGAKIIVVSNLLDFGSSELYLFNQYKEKIFDRIYKAELFDKDLLLKKFKDYEEFVTPTIIDLSKDNYRIVEKIVHFLKEIEEKLEKECIKIEKSFKKDFLYYVTMFISTYYESRRAYLNKVCIRLLPEEEQYIKNRTDSEASFLDVNLIVIEHLNYKLEKPSLKEDYKMFLGLYRAYMYSDYQELINFIQK